MSYGLKIRADNGTVILDTNFRMGRILGQLVLNSDNGSSGSIDVPGFNYGTPFFATEQLNEVNKGYFSISISGTTLSWTMNGPGPRICILTYGIY